MTVFRKIALEDNASLASIIRTVMPEFGANGPGFAIHDEEVDDMFSSYSKARRCYYVCEYEGRILGGGGIAELEGGDGSICELKKMYFLPAARGKGWGQELLQICLREAKSFGYQTCYLETFHTMKSAIRLYEQNGFQKIKSSLGSTGHFGCDTFYVLDLKLLSR
jgi:putative acetyltransferase